MENNIESIFNNISQFSKRHNMDIPIDNLSKKIFYGIIKSKNVLNKIIKDIKFKRKIKTMILNNTKDKYHFNWDFKLEKNKYIFIISSLILSLINKKENNKNKELSNEKLLLDYIFHFILKIYKNNLVSFHYITLFFHLYLDLIEKNYTNLTEKVEKMVKILPYFKKLIKLESEVNNNNSDEKYKKSINIDIYEILRKIFMMNNSNNMKSIKFTINLREHEEIFDLIKFIYNYYDKNIFSDNNKNFIKTNLINLYSNNFSNNHFNYLYNIYKKILRNFNNKNNNNNKSIENNISFMNGINEFFLELYNNENNKALKNELYFDKYFIFDINEKNSGLKTSQIKFDPSLYNGILIFFSFFAIRYNYTYNEPQVLLTLVNQEKEKYLFKILLIGNKLYLATYNSHEEVKSVLFENVVYNSYNICIFYYDQKLNFVYFYLNKDKSAQRINLDIKKNSKVYVEVGYTNNGLQNETFNGLIGPVLIFNSNIETKNQFEIFENILLNLKGNYYMIGEIMEKKNQNNGSENDYIYFNQIYYNTIDNQKIKLINEIQNEIGKLLLYINPDVVLNTIGYNKKNQFRDYQYYFYSFNNSLATVKFKIYYYFNTFTIVSDYPKKEKSFLYSFMNNRGFDLIVFNLEYIFDYLLILKGKYEDTNFPMM